MEPDLFADSQIWWGIWPQLAGALVLLATIAASAHAVLYKRDVRATIGWVGVIWLVPFLGAVLYLLFGINRIRRRAVLRRGRREFFEPSAPTHVCSPELLAATLGPQAMHMTTLQKLVCDITARPLLQGNRVAPLRNGDEAYPPMLEAIDRAEHSISMATYIFGLDDVGRRFVDHLARAVRRNVEVRLLIDDVGSRYTFPSAIGTIRRAGIPVAKFMRQIVPAFLPYANLRLHRKIMVVDGRLGFTGGINVREGHVLAPRPKHPIQDLHFQLDGPVVAHLQQAFADDWTFCTREVLSGEKWFPDLEPIGQVLARGITYGPDEDLGKMRLTLLGALACAQRRVVIVTPYFLPDESLVAALNIAALRGVQVDIILPEKNNLILVQWASTAMLWQVLQYGCRVWLSPPPFDHTKLMIVDDIWSLIGSGNWDPRSLRLNFEFNVECYDRDLAARLGEMAEQRLAQSRQLTLEEVDTRPLPVRLRDGIARLFSPYL